jgi:hypothetical protein
MARALLPEFGFVASQFGCLDQLYISESNWRVDADNPTSSAYGIPQALTGGTHDNLPVDYMTTRGRRFDGASATSARST